MQNKNGFSLLELLTSIGILGIVLVIFFQILNSITLGDKQIDEKIEAIELKKELYTFLKVEENCKFSLNKVTINYSDIGTTKEIPIALYENAATKPKYQNGTSFKKHITLNSLTLNFPKEKDSSAYISNAQATLQINYSINSKPTQLSQKIQFNTNIECPFYSPAFYTIQPTQSITCKVKSCSEKNPADSIDPNPIRLAFNNVVRFISLNEFNTKNPNTRYMSTPFSIPISPTTYTIDLQSEYILDKRCKDLTKYDNTPISGGQLFLTEFLQTGYELGLCTEHDLFEATLIDQFDNNRLNLNSAGFYNSYIFNDFTAPYGGEQVADFHYRGEFIDEFPTLEIYNTTPSQTFRVPQFVLKANIFLTDQIGNLTNTQFYLGGYYQFLKPKIMGTFDINWSTSAYMHFNFLDFKPGKSKHFYYRCCLRRKNYDQQY